MFSQARCLTAQTLATDGIQTAGANVGKGRKRTMMTKKAQEQAISPGNKIPGLLSPSVTLGKAFYSPPSPPLLPHAELWPAHIQNPAQSLGLALDRSFAMPLGCE